MLRKAEQAFKSAVFGPLAPLLTHDSTAHNIRIHTPLSDARGFESESVRFASVERENVVALSRYLAHWNANCHAVVTDQDMTDFYMDIEMKCSNWAAAERVLATILTGFEGLVEDVLGEGKIKKILVLNASGQQGQKQSLHVHIRLDRPFHSKKDVRILTQMLILRVPPTVAGWIDKGPTISGSMRIMHATTLAYTRPLIPLDLDSLADTKLAKMLKKYQPTSEREAMNLSLMRRFPTEVDTEFAPYTLPDLKPKVFEGQRGKDFAEATRNFNAATALADGSLDALLKSLPLECATNYDEWSKVMWCMKCIASQESAVCHSIATQAIKVALKRGAIMINFSCQCLRPRGVCTINFAFFVLGSTDWDGLPLSCFSHKTK